MILFHDVKAENIIHTFCNSDENGIDEIGLTMARIPNIKTEYEDGIFCFFPQGALLVL